MRGRMRAGIVASDSFKDRTVCGTWQYWFIVLSVLPVILIITLFVRPSTVPVTLLTRHSIHEEIR